jgi:sugar lactone lactonase YvrE
VTVDNGLNIYVSDENNRRVARFDARLNYVDDIRFADEEDPFRFGYPSGIGVTSYGEVWIADREKNKLCLFNNVGRFDRFLGDFGSPEGQLANPEKIVTDIDGKFYVCDTGHRRLVIYDEFGNYIRKLVFSDIDYLIAAEIEKNAIWILDGAMSRILFTDKNGKVLQQFGPLLSGDNTELKQPGDLVLLRDGRLLISDGGNRRILVCRIVRGGSD